MDAIDQIRVNFDPSQLILLNWCLAFLMFGVALDIQISDFKKLWKQPKITLIALSSQLILLPILTLILAKIIDPGPSLAVGMVLIGVCPGGNVSNYMVHMAKANAALSVTLTSITTMMAAILTPLAFAFWTGFLELPESLRQEINIDPLAMFKTISLLIVLPLVVGLLMQHFIPRVVDRIKKVVGILSLLIFLGFVIFAILGNISNIKDHLAKVFFIVLIHNTLGFLMGYFWGKFTGLEERESRTISIETGIQNSGLGLILIFNFFGGLGGMAIIAAWWGIWHLISGFGLAMYWRNKSVDSN